MFLPVTPGIGNDPFNTFSSTRQALQRMSILGPDQTFIVRIPVKFEMLFVEEIMGDGETDPKPMGGPARAKGGSDMGGFKLMRNGLIKWRTVQIGD